MKNSKRSHLVTTRNSFKEFSPLMSNATFSLVRSFVDLENWAWLNYAWIPNRFRYAWSLHSSTARYQDDKRLTENDKSNIENSFRRVYLRRAALHSCHRSPTVCALLVEFVFVLRMIDVYLGHLNLNVDSRRIFPIPFPVRDHPYEKEFTNVVAVKAQQNNFKRSTYTIVSLIKCSL